jgi:PIN domain nuclease of toxin-antitoxin system
MASLLLDTHVLQWSTAEEGRVSAAARRAMRSSDEIAVAAITWLELAQLAHRGRIDVATPVRAWLEELARRVRTVAITPAIAAAAVALPPSFPGDPADRLIYATAIETGRRLVTKDGAIRAHDGDRGLTIW